MMRDSTTGNLAYWKRIFLWGNRPTGVWKAHGMREQEYREPNLQEEDIPMVEQAYWSMEGPRNEGT
jgi:hypothetical protein